MRTKRQLRAWLVLSLAVMVMLTGAITWLLQPSASSGVLGSQSDSPSLSGDGLQAELVYETPEFSTLSPSDKNVADLGGWARVSPPGSDKVYAFSDTIGDTNIIVSQQQIPEQFKDAPDTKLKEFAESYAANRVLPTNDDVTAYIGTSAKGPQSVLLLKNDLLVLIKSSSIINDDAWVGYINSLN